MRRILGLDIGERRIGVAISTPEGGLALPLRVLERKDPALDVGVIVQLAHDEQVAALIIGYPISMDGSVGPQARRVEAFGRLLADASGLPCELLDERLTTVQAKRSVPRARGRRRAPVDDVAAAIILQSYLDRQPTA